MGVGGAGRVGVVDAGREGVRVGIYSPGFGSRDCQSVLRGVMEEVTRPFQHLEKSSIASVAQDASTCLLSQASIVPQ